LVGFPLYLRGNRVYHLLALGKLPPGRSLAWAVGLTGLSAGILFIGLILLMSFQAPDFSLTARQTVGILLIAGIVGLTVSAVTGAKIYTFRKYGRLLATETEAENHPIEKTEN
jgi:hypothetical protein